MLDLLQMTRAEALTALAEIKAACSQSGRTTKEQDFFCEQIEDLLERLVINEIRRRQGYLKNIHLDRHGYLARWGQAELTPGCRSCLKGRWTQVRSSAECNAACPFCYYYKVHDDYLAANRFTLGAAGNVLLSERDVALMLDLQGDKIDGAAWVYYEPLMDVDKILPLMRRFHEAGKHQWLYTNGLNATPEVLEKLAAAGLNELRFNLAASNCADAVLERMKIARGLFANLCIESPAYTSFIKTFLEKREQILATGVEQLNLAELHLNNYNLDSMLGEGPLYAYHHGYISPIKSRQLVYDVMDVAEKENWPLVINDCSNEAKFYRDAVYENGAFGFSSWRPEVLYRMRVWQKAVEKYDLWAAAALPDVT